MSRVNVLSLSLSVMSALGAWLTQLPTGPHWFTPNSLGALFLLVVSTVSAALGFNMPTTTVRVGATTVVEGEKVSRD